jgi:hypothetical protein
MLRAMQPEPAPVESAQPKAPRAPRRKAEVIEHVESSSDSDSGSESSYDGYAEVEQIKKHFEQEPCEYISPAALATKKTKKEAIQYLEEKSCPKIHRVKKMSAPAAPLPATAPAKREKKVKAPEAPAPEIVLAAPPAKKLVKKREAPPAVTPPPPPPAAAPEKKKRAPSEYAKLVGKHMKSNITMAEAHKRAKAEMEKK